MVDGASMLIISGRDAAARRGAPPTGALLNIMYIIGARSIRLALTRADSRCPAPRPRGVRPPAAARGRDDEDHNLGAISAVGEGMTPPVRFRTGLVAPPATPRN